MFQPDQRLLLTAALRPPDGYTFDRAVATTFTLDLTAALVAPISLGAQRWGNRTDPITLMESVRAVADRIDVFCHVGMLKVPAQATDLVAFLEPMVHEVRLARSHDLFHPKIWLLRFTHPDAPIQLRLLCSSRNLTHDASWDLLVTLDGEVTSTDHEWNQPIADLVRALPGLAARGVPDERTAAIGALADDALRAEWELPSDVEDLSFHTLGIPDQQPPDFDGSHHFIISAFVNDDGIRGIAGGNSSLTIVSRDDELARLDPAVASTATLYTLDPAAGLDDEKFDDPGLSGLHAKAVIVDHQRAFIGSMNATGQALGGNVEFMVELLTKRGRLRPSKLLDPDDPSSLLHLLREYEQPLGDPPEPDDWSLEADLRAAAAADFELTVGHDGGHHLLTLRADGLPDFDDTTVAVSIHARPGDLRAFGSAEAVTFARLQLADISPFVILRLERSGEQRATVVRARLIGDPNGRLDAVIARQVDTPEKLLRFIMLVLQLAADGASDIDLDEEGSGESAWFGSTVGDSGILESIAVALADHPEALDDIDRLLDRLTSTPEGAAAIPPGLSDLWSEVRRARKMLQR